ncbi:MAG: hypothetical protein AB7F09_20295 [Parvibaculaceae bacterium]
MIAHRFRGRRPSVPALLTETGHRHGKPQARDGPPPAPPPKPEPTSEPASQPSPSPHMRPLRNAERIATDRQKITDACVLDILLDHIRGHRELTPSQVSTAFGLLKKILPDFSNSAAPRDGDGPFEDGALPDTAPEFEVHIVDPHETQA